MLTIIATCLQLLCTVLLLTNFLYVCLLEGKISSTFIKKWEILYLVIVIKQLGNGQDVSQSSNE